MICPVCQGSQNIATFRYGLQYWPCPACHGAGVLVLHSNPFANNRKKASAKK